MQLPRPADYYSLFLLTFSVCGACLPFSADRVIADELRIDLGSPEKNSQELNVNADEPQTSLREVESRGSIFRNVSQGVRKPSQDPLVKLCQDAVDTTTRRLLSTDQHTPWQMIHGLLGLRHDFMMQHGDEVISGLEWIAQGQTFENEHWFEKTIYGGRAHPYSRPYAFEGHANQTIAILSMCGVDLDMEFGTAQGTVTMRQMIEHAKMTVDVDKDEPTWTLWALSRYLPPNARWRNARGEVWSIERLVQEQTARPLQGAACGGTHGLFALAHARNVYLRQGKQLRGVWLQAEFKIRKYINTARMQQNSNGMLSSNYFRGRQYKQDLNKRMASAGHLLEFLMIALPQEELREQWVRRAIQASAQDLLQNRKAFVKCSPLYHSVNALNIYLDRVNPRSAPEIAAEDEQPRTAMVAPRRLKQNSTELKGVPAMGISESRDLASAGEPAQPAASDDEPLVAKTGPVISGSAPTRVTAEPPQGLPAASDVPTESETRTEPEDQEKPEKSRPEGWAATAPKRRTNIDVPESKVQGSTKQPAANEQTSEELPTRKPATDSEAPAISPAKPDAEVDSEGRSGTATPTTDVSKEADPAATPESTDASTDTANDPAKAAATDSAKKPAADTAQAAGEATEIDAPEPTQKSTATDSQPQSAVAIPEANSEDSDSANSEATATSDSPGSSPSDSPPSKDESPLMRMTIPLKSVSSSNSAGESETTEGLEESAAAASSAGKGVSATDPAIADEIAAFSGSITAALEISPGQRVADISAGKDTLLKLLSEAVGDAGRVFAIDSSARRVNLLEQSVEAQQLTNVDVVRSESRSLVLGRQRVDKAILCDVYQNLEHPRLILASTFNALEAGGEFIIIDRKSEPQDSNSANTDSTTAGLDKFALRAEIQAAGFDYIQQISIPGMQHYYLMRFRRPDN